MTLKKEPVTCGIDAGGDYIKVVLLVEDKPFSICLPYGSGSVPSTAEAALKEVFLRAGIPRDCNFPTAATGTNRDELPFPHQNISEASCCARGIFRFYPGRITVLDLGSLKCAALKCEDGSVLRVARNDSCAAGTGSFLEVVCNVLQIAPAEAGKLSLKSARPLSIEATCTVFTESEIISLIHRNEAVEDILKAAFLGLVKRIYPLLLKVGIEKNTVLIGGLANNIGIISAIEEQIGQKVLIPSEPAIIAALGAALLAGEEG